MNRNSDEHQPSDGEAALSSEFMTRLNSAGDAQSRRKSQWKRSFEGALDRRKQKQARSDEFFEIYRRATHAVPGFKVRRYTWPDRGYKEE